MIVVFDPLANSFTGNGAAVLEPLSGRIRQVAGGEYSFSMDLPIDPWGKWKHLKREAIVRLPVPAETIPNSFSGIEVDVYKVTEDGAALRSAASEPQTISYTAWNGLTSYAVGSKVTYSSKNYECIYYDSVSTLSMSPPPSCSWWKQIARTTPGAPELIRLKSGTELYYVETVDTTWYKMSTSYGLVGYIRKNQVTFDHHASASENQPRTITEQLFRIKDVNIDRDGGKVSLNGVHVSYDLNGNLVQSMEVGQVSAAMAIGIMSESLMLDYPGMIATDLTDTEDGTFTGSFVRKNGMFILTDPDTGIVPAFNAKLSRDDWDLFVMEDTDTNRGYHIRYAKNVNGIQWREKTDGLVTRVMPVAKAEDGSDLLLPEVYVDSEHISDYPVVYMETMTVSGQVGKDDGSGTDTLWTEANLLDEMRAKAGERFSVKKVDLPVTEVTVQLEQLEKTAEFAYMGDLLRVVLYDMVTVSDPEIGKNMTLKVTELEYDIVKKKISGVKLSNTEPTVTRTVTGYNVANGSIGAEKLKDDAIKAIQTGAVDTSGTNASERKVSVVDSLASTSTTDALSANQGKVLDGKTASSVLKFGNNDNIAVYRFGKMCYLSVRSNNWTNDAANNVIYTTISNTTVTLEMPAGYRPVVGCEIKDAYSAKRVAVNVDGKVVCTEKITGQTLRFSGTWITNDDMPT